MPETTLTPAELEEIRERAEGYEAPGMTKQLRGTMLRQDLRSLLGQIAELRHRLAHVTKERDQLRTQLDAIARGVIDAD